MFFYFGTPLSCLNANFLQASLKESGFCDICAPLFSSRNRILKFEISSERGAGMTDIRIMTNAKSYLGMFTKTGAQLIRCVSYDGQGD